MIDTSPVSVAKGEAVAITGFGKFETRIRPAGTARNPQTGAVVKTKKKSVPKFTPGAEFKAVVNGEKKLAAPAKKTPAKKAPRPTKTAQGGSGQEGAGEADHRQEDRQEDRAQALTRSSGTPGSTNGPGVFVRGPRWWASVWAPRVRTGSRLRQGEGRERQRGDDPTVHHHPHPLTGAERAQPTGHPRVCGERQHHAVVTDHRTVAAVSVERVHGGLPRARCLGHGRSG